MIANGKVVEIAYRLTDADGEVLDQAEASEPFAYLHGANQIVDGLENGLSGLKVGDKKKITVAPQDGYGEVNPELKLQMSRSKFPADAELEIGMQFEAQTPEGDELVFLIENIEGDNVYLDGNHPLAGETLYFEIEVISVRDATQEELTHGHAHGPDGHHVH